jgi:hypothetical protein
VGDVAKAVGEIAEESLSKMAGFSENASTKIQRLSASWENLKVAIGSAANGSGLLGTTLNVATNTLNVLSGDELTRGINQLKSSMTDNTEILERFAAAGGRIDLSWQELMELGFFRSEAAAKKYEKVLADIAKKQNDLKLAQGQTDPITGLPIGSGTPWKGREVVIQNLEKLRQKQKELNDQFEQTDLNDNKKLNNLASEIISVQKLIEKYEALKKAKDVKNFPTDTPGSAVMSDRGLFTGNIQPNKNFNPEIKTSDWTEESNEALRAYQDELMKTADVAQEVGSAIGDAFATAADGQNGFVRALAGLTKDIISMYLKQSIAAMIAASNKDPTTPLPLAKIGLAAAGIAAINGLFSQIGSGTNARGSTASSTASEATRIKYGQIGERQIFDITLNVDGQQVKTSIDRVNRRNGRTGRG